MRCERLLSQLNNNKKAEITAYAFEKLCKLRSSKGSRYSDSSFRTSNDSDISEKQRLLAIQNENKPTSLELLKMKQKLEEAEANEQFKQAKEKRSLVAITPVRHSELEWLLLVNVNELPNTDNEPNVRHSYFVQRNIPKSNIDPEQRWNNRLRHSKI